MGSPAEDAARRAGSDDCGGAPSGSRPGAGTQGEGADAVSAGARKSDLRWGDVHPSRRPPQLRLRRRINNYFVYRTILRAIRDCRAESSVLMAPCGYGWFFDRFRRDGIEVVGMDLEPKAVAWARAAVSPPMAVFQGDVLAMPFADGQFNLVVSNRFLLHFEEAFRVRALRELARVARQYVLVHYDAWSLHVFIRRLRGFRKEALKAEELRGWQKQKRIDRRLLYDREKMAREGAAAGLAVKRLYRVFPLISDRVYCLYEKAASIARETRA